MTRDFRRSCLVVFLVIAAFRVGSHGQDSTPVGKLPIAKLQELADRGDPAAENELGIRYRVGIDVDKDPAKAIPWFLKAAKQGYAKAYFNLGAAYYNGDGVNVSDQDACVWFTLAADAGDQRGMEAVARTQQEFTPAQMARCELLIATAYQSGERVEQDRGKALQWYEKAADNKDGLACERLAYMYQRGLGVAADPQKSLKWLKRSADLGYVPAIYDMAYMYDKGGMGLPQDITKAKRMYETAAAGGQVEALLALGGMYREGRGAKLDRQDSLSYYLAAAEFGSLDGKSMSDKLSAELTPKQVSAAQTEAKRIKAQSRSQLALIKK
jgi:TPR repeat protein